MRAGRRHDGPRGPRQGRPRPTAASARSPGGSASGRAYADSHNGEWGPSAMVMALDAYGAPGYGSRVRIARRRAARRGQGDLDDPIAGDPARLARRSHLGDDGLPGQRRSGRLQRREGQRHLHPRPVVSVELVHLGSVRPAGHVPGRQRDGAQLPPVEAARGRLRGPRRQLHRRSCRPSRGADRPPARSGRPSPRPRPRPARRSRSAQARDQEDRQQRDLDRAAGRVRRAGSRGSRAARRGPSRRPRSCRTR